MVKKNALRKLSKRKAKNNQAIKEGSRILTFSTDENAVGTTATNDFDFDRKGTKNIPNDQ